VKRFPDAGGQILVPRHLEEAIGVERHGQHQRSPALAPVGHVPISLLEGTETSLSGKRQGPTPQGPVVEARTASRVEQRAQQVAELGIHDGHSKAVGR